MSEPPVEAVRSCFARSTVGSWPICVRDFTYRIEDRNREPGGQWLEIVP